MKIHALLSALLLSPITAVAAQATDGFVAGADAVRIHFLQSGPANASHALFLVPGWRVSASIWRAQLEHFSSRGYRVIAIDSRSQGESSLAQENAPEDRARDIHAVIGELKLAHLTLVGWSQGAQDVAAYVGRYGTAGLDALALVDSPVSAGPADVKENPVFVQVELQGMEMFSRHPREYSEGMMRAIISAPAPVTVFATLTAEAMHTPPDVGISMLVQDMFTTDRRPVLKKFDKPTLVIASAASPLLDAQKQMAAALPQGRFVAVEHAAHAVFFDQPAEFDRLLDDLIRGDKR